MVVFSLGIYTKIVAFKISSNVKNIKGLGASSLTFQGVTVDIVHIGKSLRKEPFIMNRSEHCL
jgi:hypothetical protein